MSKFTTALFTLIISFVFISCQKEGSDEQLDPVSSNLQGNYKFVSMEAKATVTLQASEGGDTEKSITITQYVTKNNTGTIKFDASTMSSNNLSYAIDTIVKEYSYFNNVLIDSSDYPFHFNVPANSSTASYKLVGSDSLYFSAGNMFIDGSNAQQQTAPGGAKLSVEGNKLYMITNSSQVKTETLQGITFHTSVLISAKIALQKTN